MAIDPSLAHEGEGWHHEKPANDTAGVMACLKTLQVA